jgi:hypothetical protein
MIDAKQAILIAKVKAAEVLNEVSTDVEEIERESYKGREAWSITLSYPKDLSHLPMMARFSANQLQYKRFLIDVETEELLAVKIREVASR